MDPEGGSKAGDRAGRHVPGGVAEDLDLSGLKEPEGLPDSSLQLPKDGMWRERCPALLAGFQGQDTREWSKAAPEEVQAGHQEEFIYREGGQALEQASWRGGQCPRSVSV